MPTQQQIEAQARIDANKAALASRNTALQNVANAQNNTFLQNPKINQIAPSSGGITPLPNISNPNIATPAQWVANLGTPALTVPPVQNSVPQSWDVVGKQKDPASVSAYLNSQPGFTTSIVGNNVVGKKNGVDTTWMFNGTDWVTKPTIATSSNPVLSAPAATTQNTNSNYSSMTPEQLKAQYMTIGQKLPGEITDEDRRFSKYLTTRTSLGEDLNAIFGTNQNKSSGTITYSPQLNHASEQYDSSTKNPDGTWTVKYKDGSTQVITESPTKTVFPEWTPEYFAQKQAEESQKQIDNLTTQMKTEEERRKQESADLTAKYGENLANQFASQKADIEAQGAKRMDTLNTGLSFSGFGRSTLALEKRDEIAKNIETTVNQAKAKADLELMAYRMEREWADASAIETMRNNIALVQSKIDQANYDNQLEIIKLNEENATTGVEAMNNLLETISNGAQIAQDADLDKSAELGYFVDKASGRVMFDSQGRPIEFKGNVNGLTPDQIQAYTDAISKGVIKAEDLDKTLTPAQKAQILKHVSVNNGTYVPVAKWSGEVTRAKIWGKTVTLDTVAMPSFQKAMSEMPANTVIGAQQYRTAEEQAKLRAEGKSWTNNSNHMTGMAVDIYDGDPSRKPSDIQIQIMNQNGWFQDPALLAKGDYGHFDYKGVGAGQWAVSVKAQAVIDQINKNGGKPQDYILGTWADSQALLNEVIKWLNSQWGSGTLSADTRTQSLGLASTTIDELVKSKDLSGTFRTRNSDSKIINPLANDYTDFVNRVDALAGQLLQIDWPTLKAMFWPQISNSDVEAIKRTILQGLDPKNQTPAAFEKTLKDIQNKMKAYIDRLPQNSGTGTSPGGGTDNSSNNPVWI